jgi:hypothetical protein
MFTFDPSDVFFTLHPHHQPWTSTPPTEAGIYKMRVGGRCGPMDEVSVYQEDGVWFAEEAAGCGGRLTRFRPVSSGRVWNRISKVYSHGHSEYVRSQEFGMVITAEFPMLPA